LRISVSTLSQNFELRALGFADPQAEQVLLAFEVDAERHINGLVLHRPARAPLQMDRVQVQDRVDRIERPALPGAHVVQHCVGHVRDQRRRHLDLIQIHEVPLDLARRQPARVKRDHLVVEARQAALALLHQLRIEIAVAIARHLDREFARVGQHVLRRHPVARVAGVPAFGGVLLVAEVRRQFALQGAFDEALRQPLQDPVLAENLLGGLAFQHLIEQLIDFVRFGHDLPP
jgi:hypothetical protein